MSNKEYFTSFEKYNEERLLSQLKPKFRKCKDCNNNKQFIEKPGQLIYTCGSENKSGKCGTQMIINLAKYVHYSDMKLDVYNAINNNLDISQFNDIYSQKEINEHKEYIRDNAKLIKQCKKPFSKQNDLHNRKNLIIKTHKNRIKLKKDQSILLEKIKNEKDTHKKTQFMSEYIQINQRLHDDYKTLHDSDKPLNEFILIKEGCIKT